MKKCLVNQHNNYFCKVKFEQHTIGILGGGQLGRMLLPPANYFNVAIACLDPNPNASCAELANRFVVGDFNDYDTVLKFGRTVDLITIEIEHVNVDALKQLEQEGKTVFPQAEVIELIQDKRSQKQFYAEQGIPTSPFHIIDSAKDLEDLSEDFFPCFQKLGKGGYDGGGVQRLNSYADRNKAFREASLVEKAIDFEKEIAIIAARNANGQVELFPTVEMVFHPEHNLVDYLIAPAAIDESIDKKAKEIATKVTNALGIVGLLAVELFVTKAGEILVNEVAPRPHNSGHQTIQGANVSQFEQHLRAILNLPLAKPELIHHSGMVNLLGNADETGKAVVYGLQEALKNSNIHPVFYGKAETRPHRKMGHATVVAKSREEVVKAIEEIKQTITIGI